MIFVFRSNTAIVKVIGPLINENGSLSLFVFVNAFSKKRIELANNKQI